MIKTKESFYYFSTFLVLILFSLILEGSLSINAKADSNKVSVNNIEELNNAWSNPNINYINIERDIDSNSLSSQELKDRSAGDITVNANNHEINLGKASFNVSQNKKDTTIYNASFENFKSLIGASGIKSTGIINDNKTTNWIYNFSNITVPEIGNSITSSISNFINAPTSQVNFSGENSINTFDENVICGGFYLSKNSSYRGLKNKSSSKSSFINFPKDFKKGTGNHNFKIEENSKFESNKPNQDNGKYSAVYNYYHNLIISDGATYLSNISSIGFNNYSADSDSDEKNNVEIGRNATFLLLTDYGVPLYFPGERRTSINSYPGANIIAWSKKYNKIMTGDTLEKATFNFDSPNQLSLITQKSPSYIIGDSDDEVKSFNVSNSNLEFWKNKSNKNNAPDFMENNVGYFYQKGDDKIGSSSSNIASFFKKMDEGTLFNLGQINANNSKKYFSFDYDNIYDNSKSITNADKTIRIKVYSKSIEGSDFLDSEGNIKYIYSPLKNAVVHFIEPNGNITDTATDDRGYASFSSDQFLHESDTYNTVVDHNDDKRELTNKVIDKIPPKLAKIDKNKISDSDRNVRGYDGENGSTVTIYNGNKVIGQTLVKSDGTWSISLLGKINVNDEIRIVMTDVHGNSNPVFEDKKYHDAILKKSPLFIVRSDKSIGPTSPKDPTKPDKDAENHENDGTKNTGELRLDYTPSSIDFENAKVPFSKKNIYANKKFSTNQQWVPVSDDRPDKDSGWELNVKQLEPFKDDDNNVIKGTILKIPKGTTNSTNGNYKDNSLKSYDVELSGDNSNEQTIFSASKSNIKDNTTSVNYWPTDKVNLSLLPSTVKPDKKYKTTLEWNLTKEAE